MRLQTRMTDSLRKIHDRLWRWQRWVNMRVVIGGYRCPLGRLQDEQDAAFIHGDGWRPEPEWAEEQATDSAVLALSPPNRRLIERHWLSDLPPTEKCREFRVTIDTYIRMVRVAEYGLARMIRARGRQDAG